MSMCWTGDGKQLNTDMPEMQYVLGKEGGEIWSDYYAVPKNAPHRAAGYALIDRFTLPDEAWWDPYYTPLLRRLPALEEKYAGDAAASSLIAAARRETEIRRRYASSFGYEFFVAILTE